MSNISNVVGNVPAMKAKYSSLLALGEGATSEDFEMVIDSDDDLKLLVQTSQIPALAREQIETFGPNGVQFVQQGRFKNIAEVPISFKEVITGVVYRKIRGLVVNKSYVDIELSLINEAGEVGFELALEDCWIELEGVDLSVEDATLVKPTGTIHANWVNWQA